MLEKSRWRVRLSVEESPEQLKDWYAPWYLNEDSTQQVGYDVPGAKPLLLTSVPSLLRELEPSREYRILRLAEQLACERSIQIVAALYDLGGSRRLVIDGNHRIAAVLLREMPFRVLSFTVTAPIDGNILPDLQHWADPG